MQLFSRQIGLSHNSVIVFLHGFLGNSNDWNNVVAHLQDDFYCVLIDLPGHGESAHIKSDIHSGFNQWHALINNCLNDLNIDDFHLVGYSLGGRIALDYARTQTKKKLLSLTLESSHSGLISEKEKKCRLINDQQWADRFKNNNIKLVLTDWYQQAVFQDLSEQQKKKFIKEKLHNIGSSVANALIATSLSRQHNALPFFKNSHLPVFYLFGKNDKKFKAISTSFADIKNSKLHSFSGVGHNIHHENPLQYATLIRNFINIESK